MAGLSFSMQTILLNGGIILILVAAIGGGIIYQQISRECAFNTEAANCGYLDLIKTGIIVFSFIGMMMVLVGFALSIIGGLNEEPEKVEKK